jgi:hypothetical protein
MVNDADSGNVIWFIKTENAASAEVMQNAATTTFSASAAGETQYKHTLTSNSAAHNAGADGENILLTIGRDADNVADTYGSNAYGASLRLYYLMYDEGIEEV